MHTFGLTGGIASGKSTVAERLRARGVAVVDADAIARDVVARGTEGLSEVVARFGASILADDGTLDRKRLGAVVFGDEASRRALNSIVHPKIAAKTADALARLEAQGAVLAAYDAALLVENGLADAFRPLVVVSAPEALQVERIVLRDGLGEEEARARVAAQLPLASKREAADFVIENASTRSALMTATDDVLAALCARLGLDVARFPAP